MIGDQVGKVRDHQIHTVHILFREAYAAVYHDHILAIFQNGNIFTDLIQSAQGNNLQFFSANLNKISFQISQNIKGSTVQFSKSRQREIFCRMKVLKAEEYFAYFPLLELHSR